MNDENEMTCMFVIEGADPGIEWDGRDVEILTEHVRNRRDETRPMVGDFIIMIDGSMQRIAHMWRNGAQTSCGKHGGSFHLTRTGEGSFSGGLNPIVPFTKMRDTGRRQLGKFWMFHHDHARAHHGVTARISVRVWEEMP